MIITREFIDLVEPEHERTSCSDTDLSNHHYSLEGGYLPRCNRCYLLANENLDTDDLDLEVHLSTWLEFKE